MDKLCCIFGAGDGSSVPPLPPRDEIFVIAADGGYPFACRACGQPDVSVGDFDSLGYLPEGKVLVYPREKDDTDLGLAIRQGLAAGCTRFWIFGALGGRLDHTLASLSLLASLAARPGHQAFLFGNGYTVTAVHAGELLFPPGKRETVSIFAHGGTASGVTLDGLSYSLRDAELPADTALGVSNEFLCGMPARIACRQGTLLVLWQETEPGSRLPALLFGQGVNAPA